MASCCRSAPPPPDLRPRELVALLSRAMSLEPADISASGTPRAWASSRRFLRDGHGYSTDREQATSLPVNALTRLHSWADRWARLAGS